MTNQFKFQVSGISCSGCASRIEKAIKREDEKAEVTVDQTLQTVKVAQTLLTALQLEEVLDNTGFPVQK